MADSPPASDTRARVLREALESWRERGLLGPDLHARLLADVEAAPPPAPAAPAPQMERAAREERRLSRGVSILVNLGAVILAAGLIVFFASNWIEFGRPAKVASLFLLTLAFYGLGYEFTEEGRWHFPALGLALVFLGCVMFGLDILLLALVYDLKAERAWALLIDTGVWLLTAYLLRSRLILFLGLIGAVFWFGAEVGYCWGGYWIYLARPIHFLGFGAVLLAVSGIHAAYGRRDFSPPYALVGLLLIYLSTLILSIFDIQRSFRAVDWQAPFAVWAMLFGPYLVTLAALLWLHVRARQTTLADRPTLVLLFFFALMLLLSVIAWAPGHREVWFVLLLTLLTGAGIYLGIAWESAVFLNTSLVFFALNLYTRFYEYFWDAMPKSLFFIIGGAILIGGGVWTERMRRSIVRRFGGGTP